MENQTSNPTLISNQPPTYAPPQTGQVAGVDGSVNQTYVSATPDSPSALTYHPAPQKTRNKLIPVYALILGIILIVGGVIFFLLNQKGRTNYANEETSLTKELQPNNQTSNQDEKQEIVRTFQADTLTNFTKEELSNLGVVSLPVGFTIQEEYKGIKLARSPKASFTASQLNLLHYYLDLTPQKLLNPGPAAIVMFKADEVEAGPFGINLDTVAFASGPYIFFNDESFSGRSLITDSSDQAYTSFEHELVHIAQFNENLSNMYNIVSKYDPDNPVYWIDAAIKSTFIADFAKIANWTKSNADSYGEKILKYQLLSPESAQTTEYGKTAVVEDMAESVAGVIATCDYQFDAKRVQWVLDYLGSTIDNLKPGKLPCNSRLQKVQAWFPDIDYDKKELYKTKYGFSDTQIFQSEEAGSLVSIKDYYQTELNSRGWSGSLDKLVKKDGVEIYKGDFSGNARDLYLELKSYDNATGYSEKPIGTTVNIISGYNF